MFAKTFCKPGAFMYIVPVGLRATLQYNAKGLLEKVFVGYGDTKVNISEDLLSKLGSSFIVPSTIPTKGGTTWVEGVFYTDKEFFDEGTLPMCIEPSIIKDMKKDLSGYTFYAGHVASLAVSFTSLIAIRNWLNMSAFKTLPGHLIPGELTNESFMQMVSATRFPFKFPLISGYMIYDGPNFNYAPINLTQVVASKVTKFVDENGYIKAKVNTGDSSNTLVAQYTDVIKFNINAKSSIVRTSSGKIVYSTCTDNKVREKRTNKLTCSICGKPFTAPVSGPVRCADEHCRSRIYVDVCHFLDTLSLPGMTADRFSELITSDQLLCLTDILLLPEYKELKIETTLDKLLQAVVPLEVCADATVFTMFINSCNNSLQTLKYYLDNPNKIATDMNINSIFAKRLSKWLSDGYNVTTLETLIESGQISFVTTTKKFNGAPIFRGKTIMITGNFHHGSMREVMSILESYEAKVVTQYDSTVNCIIVGQTKENVDGGAIHSGRSNNIKIFDEADFFTTYDIDADIAANLL